MAAMVGGYTGVARDQILALLQLFEGKLPNPQVHEDLMALLSDEDRWSEAHDAFSQVRRRSNACEDRLERRQYQLAEACLKTAYNETYTDAPFDAISPFWVVPSALALAAELSIPLEEVLSCVTASQQQGLAQRRDPRDEGDSETSKSEAEWTAHALDAEITQVRIDYRTSLLFSSGAELVVESPYELNVGSDSWTLPDGEPYKVAPVLQLLHRTAGEVRFTKTGRLVLSGEPSFTLRIEPDDRYESWQLLLPDGSMYICLGEGWVSFSPTETQ